MPRSHLVPPRTHEGTAEYDDVRYRRAWLPARGMSTPDLMTGLRVLDSSCYL